MNLKRFSFFNFFIFFFINCYCFAANYIDAYKDWSLYTLKMADGERLCYLISLPTHSKGTYSKRDDPYIMLTYKKGYHPEVHFSSGYSYNLSFSPEIVIDGKKKFVLIKEQQYSWAKNMEEEKTIISDMKRGLNMTLYGKSIKNTSSVDTYSLKGMTKMYQKMVEVCS